MTQSVFNHAAKWVNQRQNVVLHPAVPEAAIAEALSGLHSTAGKCLAAVMIPDLFPGSRLEVIYTPPASNNNLSPGSIAISSDHRITTDALSAIGAALTNELENAGNDMVLYELDGGAQAIAYFPEARDTVLQATGLVLLNN